VRRLPADNLGARSNSAGVHGAACGHEARLQSV